MAAGDQPGADFLELTSDDGSEWEDDNGTRNFSDIEGMGNRASAPTLQSTRSEDWEEERGRTRPNEYLTALPPFNQIPAHDSVTDDSTAPTRRLPGQARQMSFKRYSRVNLVHNRSSPRSSILSNASSDVMPRPLNVSRTVSQNLEEEILLRVSSDTQRHHQRITSETESIRMNAFLNAHYATLQAIDSRPNSPPAPQSSLPDPSRQRSFSEQRHIKLLAPIQTKGDPDRPPHLPAHFIKTPYPFSPKKEFPPPKTRPRTADLYITPLDDSTKKGIHVLGMAHDSAYDPRNRLERNISAQGLIRTPPDAPTKHERWNSARSTNSARESIVWLSLRRNRHRVADRLEQLTIPSSLVTTPQPSPTFKPKLRHLAADFDDMHFAGELRAAYRKLAGPWVLRALSARKLRYIRLSQISAWSGSYTPLGLHEEADMLLAARGGLATLSHPGAPFTEHALLDLYRNPISGDARYTWVHWARRVAASNRRQRHSHERARSDGEEDPSREVTTIQFVHAFSPFKILTVMVVMLTLAVAAAVLYTFLGQTTRERAEKVTPGMLIGLFAVGVEGVVFSAWVVGSWMWL
ncbi:uncharacterized protein N0V89_011121 [Didymosphaeria variabile]|uniref:Uncharacterized protein n=1 Tax=Didymosphaeria variabile TaxID=1932322 RepID=A0A9W9C7S0_9PLEO|nr:uncharacterized protein N0V89_011121 [Didymosphaeria variabile]KAJ4347182.1 hypothetical protein N0V89_011121 [Didymosphaeria variabile]